MKALLLTITILFTTLSSQAIAESDTIGFNFKYGPWNDHTSSNRHRYIWLYISDKYLTSCYETITNNNTTDIDQCFFLERDKSNSIEINHDQAMKILYRESGMNQDGTKRRFYHEWIDNIKELFS